MYITTAEYLTLQDADGKRFRHDVLPRLSNVISHQPCGWISGNDAILFHSLLSCRNHRKWQFTTWVRPALIVGINVLLTFCQTVLFEVKAGTAPAALAEFKRLALAMVGQIPGLQKVDVNPPLASTAHRAQGYNMGLVAILDKPETLQVYAAHPAHLMIQKVREEICSKTMVYDLEFEP